MVKWPVAYSHACKVKWPANSTPSACTLQQLLFFFFEKCDLEIHTRIVFLSLKHCSLSLERGSAKKGVHAIFFVIS